MRSRFDPRRSLLLIPLLALFGCDSTVTEPGPSLPPTTVVDSLSASERQGSLAGCSISPTGTNYSGSLGFLVTIASPVNNAEIHYTTDGTEPNKQSNLYSEAFVLSSTLIDTFQVKARAWSGSDSSPVVSHKYVIGIRPRGTIPAPRFSIEPGADRYRKVVRLIDAEATLKNRTCGFSLDDSALRGSGFSLDDDSIVLYSPFADTVVLRARCWDGYGDSSSTSRTIVTYQPLDLTLPNPTLSEFVDTRDGHTYKTTSIGQQIWMAENLVFQAPGMDSTSCKGSSEDSCAIYGRSYTWNQAVAVDSIEPGASAPFKKGVCPEGWHVPSQTEWATLMNYVTSGFVGVGDLLEKALGIPTFSMAPNNELPGNYQIEHPESQKLKDSFGFKTIVVSEGRWYVSGEGRPAVWGLSPIIYWWTATSLPYDNARAVINGDLTNNDGTLLSREDPKYLRCLKDSP